ncbi:hypothetical protein B5X24_HaOG208108 [Helicoverpa armigera]|nr:hypothetical protein B5X24_HaOG208108 [Helicoverpa armigera]
MSLKTIISLVLALLSRHTESSPYLTGGLRTFSLEEVVPLTIGLFPEQLSIQWISDTEYIYKEPGLGVWKFDVTKEIYTPILDDNDLTRIRNFTMGMFSQDLHYLLLTTNKQKKYRHSSTAEYWVYDLETKSIIRLGKNALDVVIWGTGRSLAYVRENNVYYVRDVDSDTAVALTRDGVPGEIYNGVTDWLYEEEMFNAAEAMWFSPKGSYLAVASFNDSEVETATYPYYGEPSAISNQYPEIIHFKYPKAGRKNPLVSLRVFKLDDPRGEPWNIPAPVDIVGLDHYLGRVSWASEQNLVVLWLNRRQNVSVLVNCDLEKDKCSIVKEHSEPNGWIDVRTPFFDSTGNKMLEIQNLYNGDQRFPHAGRFNFLSLTTEDLSPGNATVTEILGWKQDTDTVYYVVSPGNSPWLRQMWATSGGVVRCVSCREPSCHHVTASFSPRAGFAIVTCSSSYNPPKIFLYNSAADSFKLIKDNLRLKEKLRQYKLPMILFNVVYAGENPLGHVKLLLPPNMKTGEKYPMIVRVYAGPGTSRVKDSFDLEYYNTYLSTNRSCIVASIDVRGSGVLGVEAMHAINNAFGTVEVTDTLATIRSLLNVYSFIDPERVGVWGWSYGGFVSTMMLIQDDMNTLSCAAAVAPVTSWLYYDTMYTERYMDTPQANPEGYDRADVIRHAERLRGRRYLLVHGTDDDNVHYQHSMLLAKQLQHNDIEFEQMSYADEKHSLLGVSRHFYHMLDHFWTRCFKCE